MNVLESVAMIIVDLVRKGFTSEEEMVPVYDYILEEVEKMAGRNH